MFTIERQTTTTRPHPAAEPTSAAQDDRHDYVATRQRAIARRRQHAARTRAFDASAVARSSWATSIAACR